MSPPNRPASSHLAQVLDHLAERVTAIEQSSPNERSDSSNMLEAATESQNHTALSRTIDVLDSTLRANPQANVSLINGRRADTEIDGMTNAPSPEHNIILCNVRSLRHAFSIFFTYVNPNLPFLNENQFRAQFENHLVTGGREADSWSKDLFIVLVNLIYAETMLLGKEFPDSNSIPGWPEFCFADRLLGRLAWVNRGNIQMIQCLLIKARYLAAAQRIRSAYDTMSKAVQICFHISLHDQQCWNHHNSFESAMRQRIFWSLFYLDRGISMTASMPYFLRESDFNVDYPKSKANSNPDNYFVNRSSNLRS